MSRRRIVQWLVVVVVAGLAYAGVRALRNRTLPETVPTAVARSGEFLVTLTERSSLAPAKSVQVHAPHISNLIISWLAPPGSIVHTGDPIARFDSSSARQDLEAKMATLKQAQATMDQAHANATITEQQDQLALATAKNAVQSAGLDYSKAAILSQIQGDEAKLALGMAQEKLKVEQATILAHQASNAAKIATALRADQKAQADVDLDQSQIGQMQMKAPSDGVFTLMMNHTKGFANRMPYQVGDSVWPRGAFAEIPDLASLQLLIKVNEVDRGRIQVGDTVHAHLDSLPALPLPGKVLSISALAEADFTSIFPPPQVFRVLAQIDHLDPRLRPDMNASVDIVTQRIPNAIIVPGAAIFTVAGKPVVYVRKGNKFAQTAVTVEARTADASAVTGLAAGAVVALKQPVGAGAPQ
ncbi:MAG: efflux RND transporter periplasmic adaptor subunit [Terriglobales bacterium]